MGLKLFPICTGSSTKRWILFKGTRFKTTCSSCSTLQPKLPTRNWWNYRFGTSGCCILSDPNRYPSVDSCCTVVSLLSSCLDLPRVGHQEQVFRVLVYLKKHHNTEMVFDPSYPWIYQNQFERQDWWHNVYGDSLSEDLPPNMPEPRGLGFVLSTYIDSDHAGNTITRRSRTGFLVYFNSDLIHWMPKKQNSIETSSFGSEFCAMKVATEYIRVLRFKLRMMGISCTEPAYILWGQSAGACKHDNALLYPEEEF